MGGWGWGWCCCGGPAVVMVVLSHTRYNVSGATWATVTAYDGTSNSSGTLLWQYDLGESESGGFVYWQAGQPRIDADGNVYIASWGITEQNAGGLNVHEYGGRLTKIDITGALVWDYFTEVYQTNNSTVLQHVGNGSVRAPCCSIMDDGNIVFGHFVEPTSTRIMTIVDPSGSLVGGVVYPGGSIPSISVTTPICSLDCDASGNIYFTPLTASNFEAKVYKVDSSGTYIGTFTGVAQLSTIRVDRSTDKVSIGTYETTGSWASGDAVLYQVDGSALTSDWVMTLTEVAGTAATSQSNCQNNSLGLSPAGDLVYATINAKTSGGVYVGQVFAADANTTEGLDAIASPTSPTTTIFCGAACDPISGDRFFLQGSGILQDRIWKRASNLTGLWSAFVTSASTVRAIDARSV